MMIVLDVMLLSLQLEGVYRMTLAHAFFDFDFHHLPTFAAAYRKLLRRPAVRRPLKLWLVAGPLMIRCNSTLQKNRVRQETNIDRKGKSDLDPTPSANLALSRPFSKIPSPLTPCRQERRLA
jgi:hypothetical protein